MLSGPPVTATLSADQLIERFISSAPRQRRTLLQQVLKRSNECRPLIADQIDRWDATGDDWACGTLIQLLVGEEDALAEAFWARYPKGWLAVTSGQGLDYTALQQALIRQDFEEADRLTSEHLRQLAGPAAEKRGYVYYSEVPPMASVDLQTLDRLWVSFSQGRFGFSVQLRLLRSLGNRWEQLWPRIGWKEAGTWTRYPKAFTWSLDAPEGHMPLVNQLRGVRLMDALLSHPGVQQRMPS